MSVVTPIQLLPAKARHAWGHTASSARREAEAPLPKWMVYPPLLAVSLALWYGAAELAMVVWRVAF